MEATSNILKIMSLSTIQYAIHLHYDSFIYRKIILARLTRVNSALGLANPARVAGMLDAVLLDHF
jgi:hypothetical protein